MHEWMWRYDRGLKWPRNWWMELRNGEDGSICSRESEAMFHKN